jgi:hypothetical protein
MAGYTSHGSMLYMAPRCRVCGRGSSETVDIGGAVCNACLRRMNSDLPAKRRLLLEPDHLGW